METNIYLPKISAIRKHFEENRAILNLIDNSRFSEEKIAELRKKEQKLKNQQTEIDHNWKVLNICVAGDFSTGKSTFINSLLGEDLLGTKITPATAKVTTLTYGPDIRYFKFDKDNRDRTEISAAEFKKYSVKNGESPITDEIGHFEITHPCEMLKQINLYDTPGFSTAEFKGVDDALTESQISKSDLIIWLIICSNGSIKDTEIKRLKDINVPFHCVVNMIDDLPEANRIKTLAEIGKQLKKINEKSEVFPYASSPILQETIRHREMDRSLNNIFQYILKNAGNAVNKPIKLEINNRDVVLNGKLQMQLPFHSYESEFMRYKQDFLQYLEDRILDKADSRIIAQKKLDITTKTFYLNLVSEMEKAIVKARDKADEIARQISKESEMCAKSLDKIDPRVTINYLNKKKIMMDSIIFKLFKSKTGFWEAYDAEVNYYKHDYMISQANEYFFKPVKEFAKSITKMMQEEYSLDSDLNDWSESFCNSVKENIAPSIKSIPIKMQMSKVTEIELEVYGQQIIDNMISDELFFSLLKLHCKNVSYQKLQSKIADLNKLNSSLSEFMDETTELSNYIKSNLHQHQYPITTSGFENSDNGKDPAMKSDDPLSKLAGAVGKIILKKLIEGVSHVDHK